MEKSRFEISWRWGDESGGLYVDKKVYIQRLIEYVNTRNLPFARLSTINLRDVKPLNIYWKPESDSTSSPLAILKCDLWEFKGFKEFLRERLMDPIEAWQ